MFKEFIIKMEENNQEYEKYENFGEKLREKILIKLKDW